MMSSGPSIKIFSDYLAKIYNLPHESSFPKSSADGQDTQGHFSASSVKPTEQIQNEQSQYGSSQTQKGKQDAILKTNPSVFDGEGAKTSFKLPEQSEEPMRDSHEIPRRSAKEQLDEPGGDKMKHPGDSRHSDGMTDPKRNHRDKVSVAKDKCTREPKGSKSNPDGKPSTDPDSRKFSGPTTEKLANEVEPVRHVPTVVEHVLQNKRNVLSSVSSRRSLSEKSTKSKECSSNAESLLTILDDSSCSFQEEFLSSSYDQGPVRTLGRGELDGPLSQSTLKSALEPDKLFTDTQQVKTDNRTKSSNDETEMWTTAISQECVTEIWTGDVRSPDYAKDDILKQSTTKNVVDMQRILQREDNLGSVRKHPVVLATLEEDKAANKNSLKDNVAPTSSVSNILQSGKIRQPSSLVLIELKDESLEQMSNSNSKRKVLPTINKQVDCQSSQKEDDGKSDFKRSPLKKLEEIKCKSCQSVLSTREALKMHTCHSIMDKKIQSDGGTRRRICSPGGSNAEASPSVKPSPKSAPVKPKTKKKVNSIIATKDNKLAKGELLYDYAPTRKEIEEKIEADRVDENQTKLVSPRLKKSSTVFNLKPLVLHKIKDKPKVESSVSSVNSSTPKVTKKNRSPAKLTLESINSREAQLITESVNISEIEVTTETDKVSKSFEIKDPVEAIDTIRAIRHIASTKAKQKVDLPKQSLSQLKKKAECQGLTYKIRHRKLEKTDEKGSANSREIANLREKENSSQKFDTSPSNVLNQSTLKFEVKHFDDTPQSKHKNEEKRSDDKSKGLQLVKQSDEKSKSKPTTKQEFKEKHFGENTKSKQVHREECSDVKLIKPEKIREECDGKKNGRRKSDGSSKDIDVNKQSKKYSDEKLKCVQVKPEHSDEKSKDKPIIKLERKEKQFVENSKTIHENKHEHKDKKYSDVKLIKLEKTEEDDNKKSKELIGKSDNLVKVNKVKEEIKSEGKKCLTGNVYKEERKPEVLSRKDSVKKDSPDMVKTKNIVNHFEPYNPPIVIEDSPPRKRHKSDKTPTSHKERYERKIKSDEKHSRKRKHNSSPCKSGFKIPKLTEKPPKKIKGFAPNRFLQKENIKTLSVGETGISLLESLLSESQKTDIKGNSTKAMEMFDKIDSKQNKMANNKRYEASDPNERSNIINEGWDQMKNMKDDKHRKKMCETMFGNPVSNHPNNNLTYHGYKRYKSRWKTDSYDRPNPKIDFWEDKRRPMFHLTDGEPKPLPGYRFQQRPSVDEDQDCCEKSNQKIKLQEFVTFMKTIMYNKKSKKENMEDDKKAKNESNGDGRKAMEEFETFLGHYKAGLEETTQFLEFYQNQGQVELEGWQAIQIMELENQFSTFSGYYGPTEELFCVECKKRHTFAL